MDPLQAPDDLRLLRLDVPDDLNIEVLNPARQPDDRSQVPAPESTQAIGTDWLMRKSSVGL